jgi:hypothetical protein
MPPNDTFVHFGIVTVVICLLTYMLIGSLGSYSGFQFWKKHIGLLFSSTFYREKLVQGFGLIGYEPKWLQPKPVARPGKHSHNIYTHG